MCNISFAVFALLSFVWSVISAPNNLLARDDGNTFSISTYSPPPSQSPSPNGDAPHVLPIRTTNAGTATGAGYVKALRSNNQVSGTYGTSDIAAVESGLVFVTDIDVGGQNLTVVVDTGSSDTWLAEADYTCNKGQGKCGLGTPYKPSSTFKPIEDENFQFSYTDGEYLFGSYGEEEVTVADITVRNQQIAIVQSINWNGDGVSSGVLGLGFPGNSHAYSGTSAVSDDASTKKEYNPFITSAFNGGSVNPLFSLALSRDPDGGFLALGGLPPVEFVPYFASAPFELISASSSASTGSNSGGKPDYTFYAITTNGFEYQSAQRNWDVGNWLTYFGNPNDASKVQVIVDSGTTVNYLPQTIADRVNNLYEPAATYNKQLGYYTVDCNARAPEFGLRIAQETFYINSEDMIIQVKEASGNGQALCITAVSATGQGGNSILGHAFLKNVLAVFDIGASQMRFAAREYY